MFLKVAGTLQFTHSTAQTPGHRTEGTASPGSLPFRLHQGRNPGSCPRGQPEVTACARILLGGILPGPSSDCSSTETPGPYHEDCEQPLTMDKDHTTRAEWRPGRQAGWPSSSGSQAAVSLCKCSRRTDFLLDQTLDPLTLRSDSSNTFASTSSRQLLKYWSS